MAHILEWVLVWDLGLCQRDGDAHPMGDASLVLLVSMDRWLESSWWGGEGWKEMEAEPQPWLQLRCMAGRQQTVPKIPQTSALRH